MDENEFPSDKTSNSMNEEKSSEFPLRESDCTEGLTTWIAVGNYSRAGINTALPDKESDLRRATNKMLAAKELFELTLKAHMDMEEKKLPTKYYTDFRSVEDLHQTMNKKKSEFPLRIRSCTEGLTIPAVDNQAISPLSCLLPNIQYQSYMRKSAARKTIAFNRECKKLETVFTNRGLPVDKKTLHSVANKDAFNMSDLSESLPSTRTLEPTFNIRAKFETFRARRRQTRERASTMWPNHNERPLSENYIIFTADGARNCTRAEFESFTAKSVNRSKEASPKNKNLDVEKPHKDYQEDVGHPGVCPEFEKMSLDDKQEEEREKRQNMVKNLDCVSLPPLPKDPFCVRQFCSSDAMRNRNTDFETLDLRVPDNSPVKDEENACRMKHIRAYNNTKEQLLQLRKESLELMREHGKLKNINLRKVLGKNMGGGSKTDHIALVEARLRKDLDTLNENHIQLSRLLCSGMLLQMKEHMKRIKNFKHRRSSNAKSDKVVPD